MKVIIKKDGSRLKLSNDEGKVYVYYDFKDGEFYEPVNFKKVSVHSARTRLAYLRTYDIDLEESDKNIVELIRYIKRDANNGFSSLQSLASMISLFNKYSNIEKLISMGVKVIEETRWGDRMKVEFSVFRDNAPKKKVVDYFLENDLKLDFVPTLEDIEYLESFKKLFELDNVQDLFKHPVYKTKTENPLVYLEIPPLRGFIDCIKEHKLHRQTCINYVYHICEYEGIRLDQVMTLFTDYIRMSVLMLGSSRKVDKYPRHLRSVHDICAYNYSKRKKEYDEIIFKTKYTGKFSYTGKIYSIVEPKETKDLIFEGTSLHHCVGSYIDRIIAGKTLIVFLRSNECLDSPLVTVEIKNDSIVQVQGLSGTLLKGEEIEFLKEFSEKFKIKFDRHL